jgi:hypothetical protein
MKKLLYGLLIAIGLLIAVMAYPTMAQNVVCYTQQGGASVVAGSGCTYTFQSGSTLSLASGSSLSINQTTLAAQTAISVTNGGVITPTGELQLLESGGTVTATLSTGCTTGNKLILLNTVAQTIVISEATGAQLAGNYSMGQYDSLSAVCNSSNWIETARSNN